MEQHTRIDIIDILRGFSLAGILCVHTIMFFLAGPLINDLQESAIVTQLDSMLGNGLYWLGLSKFFSIFSILFGLSFYIQLHSAQRRNERFHGRYIWKMLILAVFGLIHWGFFPGDILTMYAILGVLLLPLSKISTRTLLILAILLQLGLGRVTYFAINQNELIFAFDWFVKYSDFVNATLNGSLIDVMHTGYARYPQFWNEQLGLWGRFYSSLSYFILGVVLGRSGWLEDLNRHKVNFQWLLLVTVPLALLFWWLHLTFVGGAWGLWRHENNSWLAVIRFEINELFSLFMSIAYACTFILIANKYLNSKPMLLLRSYGRTGLTTYLTQSLIATFIFFNWGLGLLTSLTVTDTLWVFALILSCQISFSYQWLKYFNYGPLEWLWRSLTYFTWVKNKKVQ